MVAAHEDAEACVCDLTQPLGLGQPTVSRHLKVLVAAGILSRDKRERGPITNSYPEPWIHWRTYSSWFRPCTHGARLLRLSVPSKGFARAFVQMSGHIIASRTARLAAAKGIGRRVLYEVVLITCQRMTAAVL